MKNQDYILYLDMDGVLVDYSGGWWAIAQEMGFNSADGTPEEVVFQINRHTLDPKFWENLKWELGGEELLAASNILFEHIHILTSTAAYNDSEKHKAIKEGKLLWLKKNIHPYIPPGNIHVVTNWEKKAQFASKLSILVDDRPRTVKAFKNEGGYGILHKAKKYRDTIDELREIAFPIKLGEIARSLLSRRRFWNWK